MFCGGGADARLGGEEERPLVCRNRGPQPGNRCSQAPHRPIKAWTAVTLRTFLQATRDDELSALWMLIATTGLRRREALGLRWSDIDLETGRAQINQMVISIGWNVHFGQPKTQAGRRPVGPDPATVEVLRKHRRAIHARPASVGTGGGQLVFCEPDGAPCHPERVYQAFRRAVIRHHLPPIPLHGLRHTWATPALQMDVHPRVVQERLGHSNIAITLQTYDPTSARRGTCAIRPSARRPRRLKARSFAPAGARSLIHQPEM